MRRQSFMLLGLFSLTVLSAASAHAGQFQQTGKLPILVDNHHWIKDPAGPVSKRTLKKIDDFMKQKHLPGGGLQPGRPGQFNPGAVGR